MTEKKLNKLIEEDKKKFAETEEELRMKFPDNYEKVMNFKKEAMEIMYKEGIKEGVKYFNEKMNELN